MNKSLKEVGGRAGRQVGEEHFGRRNTSVVAVRWAICLACLRSQQEASGLEQREENEDRRVSITV